MVGSGRIDEDTLGNQAVDHLRRPHFGTTGEVVGQLVRLVSRPPG